MSKKPDKKHTKKSELQKDDVLQAVVVADSFNKNFAPASLSCSLLPLANKKLLDYALEWLNISGVNEVIIFCTSCANEIKSYVQSKVYLSIDIQVFVSEDCRSFGDVMRAIDRLGVVRNTFIMLSADVIGNLNLIPLVEKFKSVEKSDKETCMMLLFKEIGSQRTDFDNNFILAYNSKNRIVHYQIENSKEIELPMDVLLEQEYVEIKNDLSNPGVAICSVAVPPLFSDHFDVQTINEFVRQLLVNDEVTQNTVYAEILKENQYLARVKDWRMYQIVSRDVIRRWTYPMVPDVTERYSYNKNSIYLKNVLCCRGCKLGSDVVVGSETRLNINVRIDNSVIGSKCTIGENVVIENSYIFDNVVIEDNCVIRYSVIAENCHVKKRSVLDKGCILGPRVVLKAASRLSNVKVVRKEVEHSPATWAEYENSSSEDEDISNFVGDERLPADDYDDTSSDSESEASSCPAAELDDVHVFYDEILELLSRAFDEKMECENVILEINSTRYANKITIDDVNDNVVRAILNIEIKKINPSSKEMWQHTGSKLKYFMPVLRNYIKDHETQRVCLTTVVEVACSNERLEKLLIPILQFLFNGDIFTEEVILNWHDQLTNEYHKEAVGEFMEWLNQESEESD